MKCLNCVSPKELNDKGYIAGANIEFFQSKGLMLMYVINATSGEESLEVVNVNNGDLQIVNRLITDDFLQNLGGFSPT